MIIDCFTFFNEFDILEIRLNEMWDEVDYFVLVESMETFSGKEKPLYFYENQERFSDYKEKIVHLISPPAIRPNNGWDRQMNQRDFAMYWLSGCSGLDIIMIGDVDEIPNRRNYSRLQRRIGGKGMTSFIQQNFIYYMNLCRPGGWPGTIMMPLEALKQSFDSSLFRARMKRRNGRHAKGGWHFSNLGGEELVLLKMASSGHYNTKATRQALANPDILKDRMSGSRIIKGRKLELVSFDNHPPWFRENIDRFQHLITEE